jgi:glycosyltransferase involved in cell wall biosynthesis
MLPPAQSSAAGSPKVVAAVPCFNTEHWIGDVVSKARKHVTQVIVIDDGSQDDTARVAEAAGALVVSHGVNKGYGRAIGSCFEAAKASGADILVILDGDAQHDPEDIPLLLAPILRHEADLVIGSRFLDNGVRIPGHRRFGINVITSLWNLGSRVKVSDAQSGFRAYSRKIVEGFSVREKGMSASIEIIEVARRKRVTTKEVPISCSYPTSTLDSKALIHGLGVALDVVKIRLRSGVSILPARQQKS